MSTRTLDTAWAELFDELARLEEILPHRKPAGAPAALDPLSPKTLSEFEKRFELEEEVRELEEFIATAGVPEDDHSAAALAFLQTELIRKRSLLDNL
ncbi:MAG: hypothetical protein H6978_15845 [Gammaproteobacteria bacterium]|nr:hypothetical protein [Gammaproteobacteria bacterium]